MANLEEARKRLKGKKELDLISKYELYEASVQCPDFDVDFIANTYKSFNKKMPESVREDFCGTGLFCCEWVKKFSGALAYGLDLDPKPLKYGKSVHYEKLTPEEQSRVRFYQQNVLTPKVPKVDIVVAFNFSYFIFKKRETLLNYFKSVKKSLGPNGLFFLDIFGGTECGQELEEETDHSDFTYYWDCDSFNPVNNNCTYYIHFKVKGNAKKFTKAFTYDWRMWSISEVRDLLADAGFKTSHVYWEGDDGEGGGNGKYKKVQREESCESWVSYIVASL